MSTTPSPEILTLPGTSVHSWQLDNGVLMIGLECQAVTHLARVAVCSVPVCMAGTIGRSRISPAKAIVSACTSTCDAYAALHHQRRSTRLRAVHAQVGLASGGAPGAQLLWHLVMVVSGDTILRTLRRAMERVACPEPNASLHGLGIDDGAFRRGRRYVTIIVDLERR